MDKAIKYLYEMGKIPGECRMAFIVPLRKRNDVHNTEKYRNITLLSDVLKLLDILLDKEDSGL